MTRDEFFEAFSADPLRDFVSGVLGQSCDCFEIEGKSVYIGPGGLMLHLGEVPFAQDGFAHLCIWDDRVVLVSPEDFAKLEKVDVEPRPASPPRAPYSVWPSIGWAEPVPMGCKLVRPGSQWDKLQAALYAGDRDAFLKALHDLD